MSCKALKALEPLTLIIDKAAIPGEVQGAKIVSFILPKYFLHNLCIFFNNLNYIISI